MVGLPDGGWEVNATVRDEACERTPTSSDEALSLVESAMLLRWRAPELALVLADRAVRAAGEHRLTVRRAEHLAVVALNRLGRHGEAAQRLLPALRDADVPAELRHELQVELAQCAADLGEPATALAALRPVLAAGEDIPSALRGTALVAAVESLGALGRAEDVTAALEEADELFREDGHLDRDTALLLRATTKAANAVRHRRSGAAMEGEAQARAGRELLAGLADPEHDSGQVSARLMLEMVLALLDRGESEVAEREARPMLRRPVRAAAAGAVGWLRLAIATRVHLAEGRHEPALALLADAVEVTQRHGMDAVLAECLEGLSYVHEVRGEFADALHCLRSARAAEVRHRRAVETARSALVEHCGVARREVAELVDQITALLPVAEWLRAVPDPETGLLDAEEYACRVEAALLGSAPLSQVLISVDTAGDDHAGRGALVEVSKHLHVAAPDDAILGQLTGNRIAVLLPATSGTQARAWAGRFRAGVAEELGVALTAGATQHRTGHGFDQFLTESVLVLRAAASQQQPTVQLDPAESETVLPAEQLATNELVIPQTDCPPETVASETVLSETAASEMASPDSCLSELSQPVTSPLGSSPLGTGVEVVTPEMAGVGDEQGEKLALEGPEQSPDLPRDEESTTSEEPPTTSSELPATSEEPPVTGEEPPATPEELSAEPSSSGGARRRRGTNGTPILVSDLLPRSVLSSGRSGRRRAEDRAEEPSLAPFDPDLGPPPAPTPRGLELGTNGSASDAEPTQVGMGDLLAEALAAFQEGRRPIARRTMDGRTSERRPMERRAMERRANPSDALTDPELRLPELTAEPLWQPPGTGRQSAAGE